MSPMEIAKLQAYIRQVFDNNQFKLEKRPAADDSVEVVKGGEFLGVIYRDEDEGEVSYQFHMAIIEDDLPQI